MLYPKIGSHVEVVLSNTSYDGMKFTVVEITEACYILQHDSGITIFMDKEHVFTVGCNWIQDIAERMVMLRPA